MYAEKVDIWVSIFSSLPHIHSPMREYLNQLNFRHSFLKTAKGKVQAPCILHPLPPPPSLRGRHLLAPAVSNILCKLFTHGPRISGNISHETKREGKSAMFASLGTLEYHGKRHPASSCEAISCTMLLNTLLPAKPLRMRNLDPSSSMKVTTCLDFRKSRHSL